MNYTVLKNTFKKLDLLKSKKILLFFTTFIFAIGLQAQSYVFVDIDATGNNDGSSWANAYTNLDTALANVSSIGDYVLVAEGVYKPGDGIDRNKRFSLPFNIFLIGGFDGTETSHTEADPKNNITILSGDLLGNDNANVSSTETTRSDNLYTILYTASGGEISGFTFEGGQANVNGGSDTWKSGAAIYASNNIVYIHDCVFRKNYGVNHGTITFRAPSGYNSWTYIYRNEFYDNAGGDIIGSYKSNTVTHWCYMNIYNNLFHNNNTEDAIIDIYNYHVSTNSFGDYSYKIYNNTFADNSFTNGAPIRIGYERNTTSQNTAALLIETVGNIFANNGANESVLYQSSLQNAANYESHYFYSNLIESNNPIDSSNLRATYTQIGGNVVGQSPLFEDKANNDYSISVCMSSGNDLVNIANSGLPASYTDKDFYGNPRTVGVAMDAGHCEVQQEATPINVQQVGNTLEATSGFTVYSWIFAEPPFTQYSEISNILTPTDGDGNYVVIGIDDNTCKASITYNYCSSVTVTLELVDDTLFATGVGGNEFSWYQNGNFVSSGFIDYFVPTSPGIISVNHYLFDGMQTVGCTGSASYEISCDSMPDAIITNNNGTLEVNEDYYTYQWMEGGTNLAGETNSTFTPVADGDYQVSVTGAFGCAQNSAIFSFCNSVNVSITLNDTILEATQGYATYQWYLIGGSGTGIPGANSVNYTPTQNGDYYVTASDGNCNGTSNTLTYIMDNTTAIKDFSFTNLNVYPNPTNGIVNLKINEELSSIKLFDITGKMVKTFNPTKHQLDIAEFNTGIYFLELSNSTKKSMIKVIKQ